MDAIDVMQSLRQEAKKKIQILDSYTTDIDEKNYYNSYYDEVTRRPTTTKKIQKLIKYLDREISEKKAIENIEKGIKDENPLNEEKKDETSKKFDKATKKYEEIRKKRINEMIELIDEPESEKEKKFVEQQIRDMEKSGLVRAILSFYTNKGEGGPTEWEIINYYAKKLWEEEKKDIENLNEKEETEKIKSDDKFKDKLRSTIYDNYDFNKLSSYLGKLSNILVKNILPVGLGVTAGKYIKRNYIETQPNNISSNTLLTHQYYSPYKNISSLPDSPYKNISYLADRQFNKNLTISQRRPMIIYRQPSPLGQFAPQQGYIIPRRGPAIYLKPFTQKYEKENKERQEYLRQRDILYKKKI